MSAPLFIVFPSCRRWHACGLPAFYNTRCLRGGQFDASGCPHIVSEHWVLYGGHYKQSPHLILYNIQLRAVSHFLFFIARFQFSFYWQQRQPEACILVLTYYCWKCNRLYLLIMCGTQNFQRCFCFSMFSPIGYFCGRPFIFLPRFTQNPQRACTLRSQHH